MCPPPQKKHYRTNCADPSWKLILLSKGSHWIQDHPPLALAAIAADTRAPVAMKTFLCATKSEVHPTYMDMEMDGDCLEKKIRFSSSEAEAFCQCGVSGFFDDYTPENEHGNGNSSFLIGENAWFFHCHVRV